MFRRQLDFAQAGENVGVLLRGIKREDVSRGEVLCKPGSVNVYKKFKAKVYCLSSEEGGRLKPFTTSYKPQFFIRTADITGSVTLDPPERLAMPGDNLEMVIELITPTAITEGMRFAMREGKLTVGAGVISKILE